jgi:hypothetical protein
MADKDRKPQVGEVERSFDPGEEDGYQTDTFSRNDREGVPAEKLCEPRAGKAAAAPSTEATPNPEKA